MVTMTLLNVTPAIFWAAVPKRDTVPAFAVKVPPFEKSPLRFNLAVDPPPLIVEPDWLSRRTVLVTFPALALISPLKLVA